MLETQRYLLIAHRAAIVEDLLVEDVLTELRSKFVIDRDDSELISNGQTSRKRAEKLLDLLPSKGYDAFQYFYECLSEKYGHLAELLVEGISGNQNARDDDGYNNNTGGPMTNSHRDLLTAKRVDIVDDLLVDDILTELVSQFVFDNDDVELIHAEKTSKRQAGKLLDLLVTKGDHAFGHFMVAMKNPYPHIAELLETDSPLNLRKSSFTAEEQDVVESKLLEGGVPQRPVIFTKRPRELHFLRTDLRSLTKRDAWVVLHGMAGSGKTVLAAEALRSASLLENSFPGGVFWLKVGPVDRPKLLMKMQNLCSRVDEDKVRPLPRNLEEARDRLKSIFTHQHPRALLVVDDLWSAHDARYFDIRARVLVTTRDVSIARVIEGGKCPVHVAEKLSNQQCLDILSQWTKHKVTELPNEADGIIDKCDGHPLTISMIGALLRDHPKRWWYYLLQLRNHQLSKFKSNFAYQYPSLSEAIAMSIENLREDMREKYLDFVLFDSSIKVPSSVFCLLWDMEKEEVEDVMHDLINKSLVKNADTDTSDSQQEHSFYAIHNLQLNYLLENCENIHVRHKRLVECYKKTSKGNFSTLPDDGYIYYNLTHHMLEAKLEGLAITLLTNLAWVTRKLQVAGPADTINDYIKVNKLIEEDEKGEFRNLVDFHHFVRTNAHVFVSRPVPDVVIQAALSEPANNDVYRQAKEEAVKRSKEGILFVDWCNKKETAYSLEMTLKPHHGAIHCCAFSSDAKTVVSSSSDGTAKVWEALSGKVLHSLEDHDDVVTCCAFNYDNTKVLTTSYDKTVKIWKLGSHHELKVIYKDHKLDVYCAAFDPTTSGKNVISCSADNTIRVWDCETGFTSVVCKGHSDVVRWCCFSPADGQRIASGSHDQTIKIWETDTGKCLVTSPKHDTFVTCCCFSRDGNLVYASSATFIRIWDSRTGESRGSLDIEASDVLAFALSPLGDKIAAALSNETIHLWEIATRERLNTYHGHKSWVHTVNFSSDGTQLVSGSADETVKVWPVDTTAYAKRVKLKRVFDVFFGQDKITIAIADNHKRLKIIEGPCGTEMCKSEPQSSKLICCVFSPEGNNVAIGLKSGEVKIISVETCHPLMTFVGHEAMVNSLAYNRSGSVLLSCSQDKSFITWNTETGQALSWKQDRHLDAVTSGIFFDNDQRIATSSKDGTAKVWDSASAKILFTCDHHSNEWVLTCAVSADNKKLVTGSVDSEVKVWDARTGKHLFKISPHGDCIRSLSICETNGVFATGSDDGSVEISSLVDGQPIASCASHEGWVTDMAFGKNCSQLVTVSNNIQWHKMDGTLLQQFILKGSYVRHIKSSPDFSTFVTVDNIGIVYILKVIS